MRRRTIFCTVLSLMISLIACSSNVAEVVTEDSVAPQDTTITEKQLRLDIGEILLVGFRGTTINDKSHIVRDIQEYHVGSVILFEYDAPTGTRHRNISSPSQLKQLCSDLQRYGGGRLLIGVDQEGGNVARLRHADGFPSTRSAQATAAEGHEAVRENASIVANELAEAGINLNFAPCTDVNTNPNCPIIGKYGRSFSADPQEVADCARIWIDVQLSKGVISCLKHFPGHGSAMGDTHAGLVDVSKTWQKNELDPYRILIAEGGVDMVMVAHVINRQMGDNLPASLSPNIVSEKLRKELGFNGVIVTDDMAMGAITGHYGFEQGLKLALLAGCDLLCLSNNGGGKYDTEMVPRAVNAILKFVEAGELSAQDIHASAERVRQLKKTRLH